MVLFFIFFVLFINVGSIINNRKHNYAILISSGMSWRLIAIGLFFQMLFSYIVAFFVSLFIYSLIFNWVLDQVHTLSKKPIFEKNIITGGQSLLELNLHDYILMTGIIILSLVFSIIIHFYYIFIRTKGEPSRIF